MKIKFIDVDGISTRCLIAGDQRSFPILFLHGYGSSADSWIRNIDALSDEFFVIAPDMIGCGFTKPVKMGRGATPAETLAHLRKLIDKLGLGKFCPIGTSYGSLIAALLYFEFPQRVGKLVIAGSGSCFNTDEQLVSTLNRMRQNFRIMMEDLSVESSRNYQKKQCYDPTVVPEEMLLAMTTAYAQPGMKEVWEDGVERLLDLKATAPYRILHRLEQMHVDTLVIWGRQDVGAIHESAVAAVRRLPKAKLITLEKCGHRPMLEHPDLFNGEVRSFLRSRS